LSFLRSNFAGLVVFKPPEQLGNPLHPVFFALQLMPCHAYETWNAGNFPALRQLRAEVRIAFDNRQLGMDGQDDLEHALRHLAGSA